MTCKDCIHYDVCIDYATKIVGEAICCHNFMNKSRFVELRIRKGEWIKNEERVGWHCSCCGKDNVYAYLTYYGEVENLQDYFCPNCGADMRGDE